MPTSGFRAVLALVAVAVVVVIGAALLGRATPEPPFSTTSFAPEGYAAVAELLEGRGVDVRSGSPEDLFASVDGAVAAANRAVVVPLSFSLPEELVGELDELARDGTRIVFGSPVERDDEIATLEDFFDVGPFLPPGPLLAREPASPVAEGTCDLPDLDGLGTVDSAFVPPVPVGEGDVSCYGDGVDALFVARSDLSTVTLGSPLLWSNARLQPAKEDGGRALANGATAVAVLADRDEVWFLDVTGVPGAGLGGTQDPLSLLPLPVKLALAQLVGALLLYLWWRGRRFGRPPLEPLPVEIAGSELVVAVGDLMRRRSARQRAAGELRADTRRQLCRSLGLAVDVAPDTLVARLTAPTGRSADELFDTLYGAREIDGDAALVDLGHRLDQIRQEVLDVRSLR